MNKSAVWHGCSLFSLESLPLTFGQQSHNRQSVRRKTAIPAFWQRLVKRDMHHPPWIMHLAFPPAPPESPALQSIDRTLPVQTHRFRMTYRYLLRELCNNRPDCEYGARIEASPHTRKAISLRSLRLTFPQPYSRQRSQTSQRISRTPSLLLTLVFYPVGHSEIAVSRSLG